ncbi:ABC transporter permease [Rhabdothermincola salaria]|uniref:ABC transporter permease n=1 Tax=Rhabdothermincola salaria TaxID=2903142 RepID=UPI001E59ACFD|nr:ABC transporter permease [Rhabdothermincola salaria]
MPEAPVLEDLPAEPEEPTPAPRPTPARPWARVALLPLSLVLLFVALDVMAGLTVWAQAPVVAVGLAAFYMGLDALLFVVKGRKVNTGFWLAVVWVVGLVLLAVFADLLPLGESEDTAATLRDTPRLRPDLFSAHPLGTDNQALDILAGVIYGARVSLQVSFLAVAIGMVGGGLLGISAGFFRGKLDAVVGVFADSMLAFPPLILLLAVVAAVDASVLNISLALALLSVPTYTRLARANTLTLAQREFVLSARAMGAKDWRIIAFELVPNVVRPLLSYSFIIIAVLIVAEASLSFLGVGIQRPTPTWGNMIAAGQNDLQQTPHLVFVPGAVMFVTVFALNKIGDRARAKLDPRASAI